MPPLNRKNFTTETTRNLVLCTFGFLVIVGLIIAIYINSHMKENASQESKVSTTAALKKLARNTINDPLALGKVNAPVTLIEYSDYRCPYCVKFFALLENSLKPDYINTGKLRIEWRDFPVLGAESLQAAHAGRAAAAEGKFWDYLSAIYKDAPESGHATVSKETLVHYATKVGITDTAKFITFMESETAKKEVQKDIDEGTKAGVESTPTVIINGQLLTDLSLESIKKVIEKESTSH